MQLNYAITNNNRFIIGIILNSLFVIVELIFGFKANSVALLADAVHNASDVVGLILVWGSFFISKRQASLKFTYGFKNVTILVAFLNSVIIFLAISNLIWESLLRLSTPQPVQSTLIIIVATIGSIVNGTTALLFLKDRQNDLNILSVFLNMLLDTLLSISIVVGAVFIWWFGWVLIDPILGIVIAISVIFTFWGLFKESLHLIFLAVPQNINLQAIIDDINSIPEIISYHDLHVWPLSTTEVALSVHVVTNKANFAVTVTNRLSYIFRNKYNIQHSTIQLEVANNPQDAINCQSC